MLKPDPSGMRLASFSLPSDPDADCSVTVLPGTADGVQANVDRWRKQMGLGPMDPAEMAKMPQVAMPLRQITTGRTQTPSIDAVLELLGREVVLHRLTRSLDAD